MKNLKHTRSLLSLMTLTLLAFNGEAFAKLCPSSAAEQETRNVTLTQKCGAGISWDLSQFAPDNTICTSRKQGIELVENVVNELCAGNEADFKSKIKTLRIKTWTNKTTAYELKDSVLLANVPIEETPILTNWSNEAEKLRKFIRETTGLKLQNAREKERGESDKKDAAKKAELEGKANAVQAARDQKQAARLAAQDKLKAEMEKFKAKTIAIMSRPGTSPDDMTKKQKEVAEAQAEFNKAQAVYDKEMAALK